MAHQICNCDSNKPRHKSRGQHCGCCHKIVQLEYENTLLTKENDKLKKQIQDIRGLVTK